MKNIRKDQANNTDSSKSKLRQVVFREECENNSCYASQVAKSCVHYFQFIFNMSKDETWLCGFAYGVLTSFILVEFFV